MWLSLANGEPTRAIKSFSSALGRKPESRHIDTDFGQSVFLEGLGHSGLIRLPDFPSAERLGIMEELIERFASELEAGAIITVRSGKIRISQL